MTDWAKLIADLEASGVTLYKISVVVGRQYHLVKRWTEGAEPKHSDGEKLIELHDEVVGAIHAMPKG